MITARLRIIAARTPTASVINTLQARKNMPVKPFQTTVDPACYAEQLQQKRERLTTLFSHFTDVPELEVFPSESSHYRLRTEFRIWHEQDRCFYAMFEPGNRSQVYEVTDFPVASLLINDLMIQVMDAVHQSEILKQRLFGVEFLTTLSGDALITLIYHKKLEQEWHDAATELQNQLGFPIVGRSRKQKVVLDRDYVTETLHVDDRVLHYRQLEGGFTQPNGLMNQQMLSWTRALSAPLTGDLVELYCGNGNFSIALADCFDRVLATEISKTSVAAAQVNIAANNCDNVIIARLSAEEFVQALTGERQFTRLQGVDLADYQFNTVLVDPPRAGLDEAAVSQIQAYDNIIYISCNPDTLLQNLQQLNTSHRIIRLALFDQFPYTHHVETGVLLQRR